MQFIHDTRDKAGKHKVLEQYLAKNGHAIIRSKLFVGDVSLLANQSTCIDLKQNLAEVEGNLTSQHERFRAECQRAEENGIRLIVLVQEGWCNALSDVHKWQNPRRVRWERINNAHSQGRMLGIQIAPRPPIDGYQLQKIMQTMQDNYHVQWAFCPKQEVGQKVCELLGVETTQNAQTGSNSLSQRPRFVSR